MWQIHVRLSHFFLHRNLSQSPHMFTVTHTLHYLIHLLHKQMRSGKRTIGWTIALSNPSSSAEWKTAATSPAPAMYAEAASASPTQAPALAITSPVHSPTHSNTYTPPVSSCQAQTILIDNITTNTHTRGNWNQAATTISRGSLCANIPQVRRPSACIGNSQRDQHHLETNKMVRGFLWERPLHTSGQQGRAPLTLCRRGPSNNGIGKYQAMDK